jgi:hypothetical protein
MTLKHFKIKSVSVESHPVGPQLNGTTPINYCFDHAYQFQNKTNGGILFVLLATMSRLRVQMSIHSILKTKTNIGILSFFVGNLVFQSTPAS